MSRTTIALESLESRTLFAAQLGPVAQADLAQVQADVQQLRTDKASGLATLRNDRAALITAGGTSRANIILATAKLKTDALTFAQQFKANNATLVQTLRADTATIKADLVQIRLDRGNFVQLAADRAKLVADTGTILTHKADAKAALLSALSTRNSTLKTDLEAIVTARTSDPSVVAARTTLINDALTLKQTLSNGLLKLAQDRVALVAAIRAGV